ncbi:MAG TPA: chorismate synthase [Alphaproteobacteria bacterium]|nr:chorismate synthase [Alphaproteobacteria bacterium]
MSDNTFGHLFRFTTWGESHGPAIGVVVDGVPAGIPIGEADIQAQLDRRRPGQSRYTTQRQEPDRIKVLSGVFEGMTTGTAIGMVIENTDQRSRDYGEIKDRYRPGHADYTYQAKYGIRDYRGGGRSSARETAMRVAAGAVARAILTALIGPQCRVRGALVAMGGDEIDRENWDWSAVGENPFFCPDRTAAERWAAMLDAARKDGSSLGAVIELIAENVPPGLGAPIYGKLDSDLAAGLMSINAVKGVEIGDGFASAAMRGEDAHDCLYPGTCSEPRFETNHAGGVLGGISTGQPVIARFAVKPTSSILISQPSISVTGEPIEVRTKGRHDPCVGIRAVPVGEAMMAIILADHLLRQRAQNGETWR